MHEKKRDDGDYDDQRREHHGATRLDGSVEDDLRARPSGRAAARFVDPSTDRGHDKDGVVHHRCDGGEQPGQHQHVDVDAAQVEHEQGREQRQCDGDGGDHCRLPAAEQHREPDRQQNRRCQQGAGEIVRRPLDVARGSIDISVDVDPGHAGFQFAQRRLEVARDMLGVESWKLVDHQDEARPILQQGVTDQWLMALDHLGRRRRERPKCHGPAPGRNPSAWRSAPDDEC